MKNSKLKIKKFGLALFLHFAFCVFNLGAITPWTLKVLNATNAASLQQMGAALLTPPDQLNTPFTVNGTNAIFGGNATSNFTFVSDSSGVFSNALYAGTYKFVLTNLNAAFIAQIPDTAVVQSLTLYITNAQVFSGTALDGYSVVTNLLTFSPATNSAIGILAALNFQPATNTALGILTPLNFQPATNTALGILTPLNFQPATNTALGILTPLGFQPASNSFTGIVTPLGYTPGTNDGYTGLGALSGAANIVTNGGVAWVFYKTNNDPGPQFTNLPMGSLMSTTNGQFYVLSNIVWRLK